MIINWAYRISNEKIETLKIELQIVSRGIQSDDEHDDISLQLPSFTRSQSSQVDTHGFRQNSFY